MPEPPLVKERSLLAPLLMAPAKVVLTLELVVMTVVPAPAGVNVVSEPPRVVVLAAVESEPGPLSMANVTGVPFGT